MRFVLEQNQAQGRTSTVIIMGQLRLLLEKQRVTTGIPPKYDVLYILLFLFLLNYSRAAMLLVLFCF